MVTEHVLYFVLKSHFWVLNAFCLLDLLLFLFSECLSYAFCGIWFRFGMAHVSASDDSMASVFISVRIGFEPCDNHYIQLLYCSFCIAGPGYLLLWQDAVSHHGYLSFDPFFTIVASLKAMQCVKLRA